MHRQKDGGEKCPCRMILASGSPRRLELLKWITDDFSVIVPDCEEVITSTIPEQVTAELARQKAEAVALSGAVCEGAVVIGADTVVSKDGTILGKPGNREDALSMLRMLSGGSHKVSTGVALIQTDGSGKIVKCAVFSETTLVHVAPMRDEEIEAYADTKEPYDKAGGYGIQGAFGKFISGIEGDYNNVVGLPLHRLYMELKKILDI